MNKQEIIDFINNSDNIRDLIEIQKILEYKINKIKVDNNLDFRPSISSLFNEEPSESELWELARERSKCVHYTWVQHGSLGIMVLF